LVLNRWSIFRKVKSCALRHYKQRISLAALGAREEETKI